MVKYLTLKLSDDVYEELKRKAEEEGYALVSDYVRELILRGMGKGIDVKRLEERLEELESMVNEERIKEIVKEVAQDVLAEVVQNVEPADIDIRGALEEALSKLERKFERKLDDMLNPWTQKVDELARRVAELQEKVEELEETINELKQQKEEKVEEKEIEERRVPEKREKKGKLFQIFRERKVYFEGKDLGWAKNKERIIDILVKHGAIKIETEKWGRILVHPEAWEEFVEALRESTSGSDEEVYERLHDEKLRELFDALRKEGILYFDSSSRVWKLITEDGEEKTL